MVELTGASSDVLSEADKRSSENMMIDQENNTNANSEVLESTITEQVNVNDNSRASSLVVGETQRMKVLHVESPREVFFMKSSDKESFSALHGQITKEAESSDFQPDFCPRVGSLVLVKASDNHWYRGEVISIEGPAHLRFYAVDFGFTELVKKKRVREIQGSLRILKTRHYFGEIF